MKNLKKLYCKKVLLTSIIRGVVKEPSIPNDVKPIGRMTFGGMQTKKPWFIATRENLIPIFKLDNFFVVIMRVRAWQSERKREREREREGEKERKRDKERERERVRRRERERERDRET